MTLVTLIPFWCVGKGVLPVASVTSQMHVWGGSINMLSVYRALHALWINERTWPWHLKAPNTLDFIELHCYRWGLHGHSWLPLVPQPTLGTFVAWFGVVRTPILGSDVVLL